MAFLHGVEVIEVDAGARPIEGVSASVIGLLGAALTGPVKVPTLISSRTAGEEAFGSSGGTIAAAVAAIFEQASAQVVVVNALDPSVDKTSQAEKEFTLTGDSLTLDHKYVVASSVVVKSSDGNTPYTVGDDYTVDAAAGGVTRVASGDIDAGDALKVAYDYADAAEVTDAELVAAAAKFVEAESVTGSKPRILIAPGYTEHVTRANPAGPPTAAPVTTGLVATAERLRAVIVADGPNTTRADAIAYRGLLSSRRVYVVDPGVRLTDAAGASAAGGGEISDAPASARIAGLIVRNDRERGYWSSPSNRQVLGISGTGRAVDFTLGDASSEANLLNDAEVATIIRSPLGGYRLWGNRTASADAKWTFLGVVRTADVINESLLRAHLWAVDRNLTATYVEDVVESVNDFLRRLQARGAILSGRCWADPALNDAAARDAGRVYFDFEFDPPSPAERITFRSQLVSG
ncbi:MAG: phage tail sheath subtilisin-like domain-containing protein [Bryobacterales bacterium]|nr:phage tail sheath subtilisin-like domain-containing protein [Bryobacterales bacterium]